MHSVAFSATDDLAAARLDPSTKNDRFARQGGRHPPRGQVRHLPATPGQHRRRAARRRAARGAGDAAGNTHLAPRGALGCVATAATTCGERQRHPAHWNRGAARTPLAPTTPRPALVQLGQDAQTPPPRCPQRAVRARTHATTARAPCAAPARLTSHESRSARAAAAAACSHRTAARATRRRTARRMRRTRSHSTAPRRR